MTVMSEVLSLNSKYSRTSLFRTRLIRSPRYFEGRSNALGFTLPRLFRSPAISNFFPFPLGLRNGGVRLYIKTGRKEGGFEVFLTQPPLVIVCHTVIII